MPRRALGHPSRAPVGRDVEVAALRAVVLSGGSAVVAGPAGIGKTAVVEAALSELSPLVGVALPSLRERSYLPLQMAFGRALAGTPDEVAAELVGALGDGTVVIEDLHWADEATLAAAAALSGVTSVVVTSRTEPATAGGRWGLVLGLAPLRPRHAAALARRLHPALDAAGRSSLLEAAAGNPLLLEILAVGATSSPTLEEAVRARLATLSDATRLGLERLSLLGRPASPAEIGLDGTGALGDLVIADGDRLALRHDLLGEAVAGSLGREASKRHRELAARLSDAEAARHHLDGDEPSLARQRALAAAAATPDAGERAALLEVAVRAAEVLGEVDGRLLVDASAASVAAGRWSEAAELARRVVGEAALEAEAALHRGRALWFAGRVQEARSAFRLGRERTGADGTDLDVRLAVERAYLEVRDRTAGALAEALSAHRLAAAAGRHLARAEAVLGAALLYEQEAGWEAMLEASAEHASVAGDHELACEATYHLVSGLGFHGRLHEGLEAAREGVRRAEPHGLATWSAHFTSAMLMNQTITAGDREEVADQAAALLEAYPTFRNLAYASFAAVLALTDLSRRAEADALLERMAGSPEGEVFWSCAVTELGWLDRDHDALAAVQVGRAAGESYFGLRLLAEVAAQHLAVELDVALPTSRPATSLLLFQPALDELAGLERWRAGDVAGALSALDGAASRWMATPVPRYAVRAAFAASLLAERAGRSDAGRRRERALATARRHGLEAHVARLERPPSGALTAREREVLGLVADGRTSAEIATVLGIAHATVDQHVRAARRKLGAVNRRAAVSLVRTP